MMLASRLRSTAQRLSRSLTTQPKPDIAEMRNAARMCELASANELAALQELIKSEGMDVSARDYDYRTPLHVAAQQGNAEIVEFLLSQGAHNQFDKLGGLPIHDAVRGGHNQIANLLRQQPVVGLGDAMGTERADQMALVLNLIVKQGVFSFSMVSHEVEYFFNKLGLDAYYFELFNPAQMSQHVHSFIAAKKVAEIGGDPEKILLQLRDRNTMLALFTDQTKAEAEAAIENYIANSPDSFHMTYMKSANSALQDGDLELQMYVVTRDDFQNPVVSATEDDLYLTSTPLFLRSKPKAKLSKYQEAVSQALQQPYPVVHNYEDKDGQTVITIAHRVGAPNTGQNIGASNKHSARHLRTLTRILDRLDLNVTKKYADTFSNGVTVYNAYVNSDMTPERIQGIIPYLSMGFAVPDTPLFEGFLNNIYSGRELIFLHSACRFAYYFQREANEHFEQLKQHLEGQPDELRALNMIAGEGLGSEFNTLPQLYSAVQQHPDTCKAIFVEFARRFTGDFPGAEYPDVQQLISQVRDPTERGILETFSTFADSITTTNLWKAQSMSAIGWRLDPSAFLCEHPIPEVPFSVYMMLGYDFTGFHIRFRDISRGGVRLIQSTKETYHNNRRTQFQENYNLAYTQKLKNKDIPESGSKGTILMKPDRGYKSDLAMMQYVDTMMDIVMKESDDSIKDRYGKEEYIFLGPDEGTAGYMDQASIYSRDRGYSYWRAFTTGKSTTMGGVPHDTYGMTTRSVRAYTEGLQRELGMEQSETTKMMTGGPDGDLGSNEILMGKEKIVGICDGSGVLCDPEGLDRAALERLATDRLMIEHFDGKLSGSGFMIKIGDKNVNLPDGTHVNNGTEFRNNFHLWEGCKADFFVPCGGRPGSINNDNVHHMFDSNGNPRFAHLVEGANLFVTEGARDVLQDRGVLLYKDASTNKGGVTSSSLEVLAGLAMDEQEFSSMMCVQEDGTVPDFYKQYVQDVIKVVETNANQEFSLVYEETLKGKRSTRVTDELSEAMNGLNDVIGQSNLWENQAIRKKVLGAAIPASLQTNVNGGLDTIMGRVPENYLKAIFSMTLASQFIYKHGSETSPYAFYEFMSKNYDN
eukprot:TRINITY_DN4710_c0_g1_i6.p1 TRINITY_DN4710_c0_g1~~TRINITY_DN4710_c0_g1_i6.p1  ORF type:complete len:1094 (-),score=379.49 TRINITY_DN4710_c0_g1_i6:345-3626(-)